MTTFTVESLAIGDELMRGEVVDSNSAHLGRSLLAAGWQLHRTLLILDDEETIAAELRQAAQRSQVVVVSGGLGPTVDDRTAASAARAFGRELVLHQPTLDRMRALFAARGYSLSPNNEKQAMVPRGATVLDNPNGTAPGFLLQAEGAELFFLPGVPREYHHLVTHEVLPRLASRRGTETVKALTFRTLGATESKVDQLLRDADLGPVRLSTRVFGPEVHIVLIAVAPDEDTASLRLGSAGAVVRERLGDLVFGTDDQTLAGLLGEALMARGWSLAIAESCTGGLVAAEVTNIPGSSRYLRAGIVAYANQAKVDLLGVPPEILERHGAVSEETARAMARGVRERTGCEVGIGVTGIAGPTGGTDEKPVGLVHIAASGAREVHRRVLLPPGRERVRSFAARIALAVTLEAVRG